MQSTEGKGSERERKEAEAAAEKMHKAWLQINPTRLAQTPDKDLVAAKKKGGKRTTCFLFSIDFAGVNKLRCLSGLGLQPHRQESLPHTHKHTRHGDTFSSHGFALSARSPQRNFWLGLNWKRHCMWQWAASCCFARRAGKNRFHLLV